jgi:hypothetical protein
MLQIRCSVHGESKIIQSEEFRVVKECKSDWGRSNGDVKGSGRVSNGKRDVVKIERGIKKIHLNVAGNRAAVTIENVTFGSFSISLTFQLCFFTNHDLRANFKQRFIHLHVTPSQLDPTPSAKTLLFMYKKRRNKRKEKKSSKRNLKFTSDRLSSDRSTEYHLSRNKLRSAQYTK